MLRKEIEPEKKKKLYRLVVLIQLNRFTNLSPDYFVRPETHTHIRPAPPDVTVERRTSRSSATFISNPPALFRKNVQSYIQTPTRTHLLDFRKRNIELNLCYKETPGAHSNSVQLLLYTICAVYK
jgi:hypothetical protein